MKLSSEGLELICNFEGYHTALSDGRCVAYRCPANVLTIGWGCTENVKEGMIWTRDEAAVALRRELEKFEAGVMRLTTVPLNQNQFDGLVSLTYNIGLSAFERSTIRKRLNAGDYSGAASAFELWNKGGGRVLRGLVNRRAREATLFLTPMDASPEPDMPQSVQPSAEPVSKPTVAVAAASSGVLIPAVPTLLTDNAANASTWQSAGDQIAGLVKWAVVSPLALLVIAATAALLFLPRLIGGRT